MLGMSSSLKRRLAGFFLLIAFSAPGASEDAIFHFDIQPQPLSSAIRALSERAGIQALYAEALVEGRASAGLRGAYTVRQALERLLQGSGLRFEFSAPDIAIVKAAPESGLASDRPGSKDTSTDMPVLVVSATRDLLELRRAPASVNVVTSLDLEKRGTLVLDQAVSIIPGAYSRRFKGFMDAEPRIMLRGMPNQARTLIMLDGIPLNNAYNGAVNFNSIDVDGIERIEIARGPFSSLYGGSAMGGVVNIFTKRVEKPFGMIRLGYGDAFHEGKAQKDLFDVLVRGGLRPLGALGLSASYRYRSTDGYPTTLINRTAPPPAGISGAVRTTDTQGNTRYAIGTAGYNGFREDVAAIRGDYAFPDGSVLDFSASLNRSEYDYDMPTTFLRDEGGDPVFSSGTAILESDFLSGTGGIEQTNYTAAYTHGWNEVVGKLAIGYISHGPRWFTIPGAEANLSGGPGRVSENDASHWLVDWQLTFPLGRRHSLTAGFYLSEGWAHNQDYGLTDYKDREAKTDLTHESRGRIRAYALFLQDQYDFSEKVTAYLGARLDSWENGAGMSNQVSVEGFPRAYPDHRASAFSPKLALVYKYAPRTSYRVSIGRAFRAPSISELFHTTAGATGIVTAGNPELRPETTVSWEVGVSHTLGSGVNVDLVYFDNAMKGFIYRRTVNPSLREYDNAGEAYSRGYELGLSGGFAGSMQWYANYTYVDARIVRNAALPESEGKFLTLIPNQVLNLGADWERGRFSVGGGVRHVDMRFGRDDNLDTVRGVYGGYDAYTIAEARAGYRIGRNVSLSLFVHNLFDQEYYDLWVAPRRSWFAQVSFNL